MKRGAKPLNGETMTPAERQARYRAARKAAAPVVRYRSAEPGANRTATVEFLVADVDAEFVRLKDKVEVVFEPKTMPWGNRSAQFRDPEGTLVGLFAPITGAAKARFGSR